MNYKPRTITDSFRVVFLLQIVSLIVAIVGVSLMVYALRSEHLQNVFTTSLFLLLISSAVGVMLTIYSLRHY